MKTMTRAATFLAVCTALLALASCQSEVRPEAIPTSDSPSNASSQGAVKSDFDGGFWGYWSDGKAELNGYDIIQPRYGQKRPGRAVLVFVTEPYSRSRHVKVDHYDRNNPDHAMALKLNHVRKFQTGIYDYSVMTSVFAEPQRDFKPLEITFSMQEWCGHVFEEAHFDDKSTIKLNSYFDGESGQTDLKTEGDFVAEDALFIQLRSLASAKVQTKDTTVKMLASATERRMLHTPARLFESTLKWSSDTRKVTTTAGDFEVHEATWKRASRSTCTAQIEAPYPHRIIGWTCTDGEKATLTGSARLAYWGTHNQGDENLLKELGLKPLNFKGGLD